LLDELLDLGQLLPLGLDLGHGLDGAWKIESQPSGVLRVEVLEGDVHVRREPANTRT
jgi:hypothetical protein